MFKCDICSRTYQSERRYNAHVTRCENGDDGNMSDNSTHSVHSAATTRSKISRINSVASISDVEIPVNGNSTYYKAAQKLSRDKKKLKAQLRKFSEELKHRVIDHRDEMEKLQNYYREEIRSLTEERDRLLDDLHNSKNDLFDEKERLRSQYSEKIQEYRDKLNKKYGSSTQTKRLEKTILTLQDQLNDQLDEQDRMKETLEKHFADKEEAFRKDFAEKDSQLRALRIEILQEREELSRLNRNSSDEKERFKAMCEKQKQEEINQILGDKHTAITQIENTKKHLQHANDTLRSQIIDLQEQHARDIYNNELKLQELVESYSSSIKEERELLETRCYQTKLQYDRDLESATEKLQENLEIQRATHEQAIQELQRSHLIEMENADRELRRSQDRLFDAKENMKEELAKKEKEILAGLQLQVKDIKARFDIDCEEMKKNYKKAEEKLSAEIGRVTDHAQKMEQQVAFYKGMTERIKENTASMNDQFIKNLNRQNILHKTALDERDNKIRLLETETQALQDEFLRRLNDCQQRVKIAEEKSEKSAEEQNRARELCKEKDEHILASKKEILKLEHRLTTSKSDFLEKINNLAKTPVTVVDHEYRDKYEQLQQHFTTAKARIDAIQKEYDHLVIENGKELSKIKAENEEKIQAKECELKTTVLSLKNLKQIFDVEKQKSVEAISKLTKDSEMKIKALEERYDREQSKATSLSSQLTTANIKFNEDLKKLSDVMKKQTKEYEESILAKETEVQNYKNHLRTLRDDIEKGRVDMDRQVRAERDRGKAEMEDLKESLERLLSTEINKRKQLEQELKDIENNNTAMANHKESDHKKTINLLEQKIFTLETVLNQERTDNSSKLHSDIARAKSANDSLTATVVELQNHNRALVQQIQNLKMQGPLLNQELAKKEKELGEREQRVIEEIKKIKKNPPTRLLDPSLKKSRDEALAKIRSQRVEITELQTSIVQLKDRLKLAESVVAERDREKQYIVENNKDVKQSFVNTLNQTTVVHKRELEKKDKRIQELESLLMSKVK